MLWDPVAAGSFTGYRVLFGEATGSYTEFVTVKKSVNDVEVHGLKNGKRYFFVVAAYDDATDNEGPFSNEVSKYIP